LIGTSSSPYSENIEIIKNLTHPLNRNDTDG
jgi:hypothetical protein